MKHVFNPQIPGLIILFTSLLTAGNLYALDHSGAITTSETWFAADNPHILTGTVTVNAGVTLTIEDGAEILANSSRALNVYGNLLAVSATSEGITFEASTTSAWGGLGFYSTSSGTLNNCLVDRGSSGITVNTSGLVSVSNSTVGNGSYGINASSGTLELSSVTLSGNSSYGLYCNNTFPDFLDNNCVAEENATGIYVNNFDSLDFSDTVTIRNNSTTGLHLNNCESPSLDNLVFEGNTGTNGAVFFAGCGEFFIGGGMTIGGSGVENTWPLSMDADSFPSPACVLPATGNTNNNIRVHGGSASRTVQWPLFAALDYLVTGTMNIAAEGQFIVPDGMEIYFNSSRGINVYGTFTAEGSAGDGISFLPNATSNWAGIGFYSAGEGTLNHCTIDQASSGITFNSSGALSVAHTTISNGSYGINASGGTLELASCNLSGNSSYGLYANGVTPVFLDGNNLFAENGTGIYCNNLASVNLTTAATFVGNTTGLHFNDCQSPNLDNLVFESHTGANGAIFFADCGEFLIGGGTTIGGPGVENTWPVSMNIGSYPHAGCMIPSTGNTNNNLRVHGGSTDRTVEWPFLAGLDYIVTGSVNIAAGGEFIVPAGMEIYFNSSRGLNIYGTLTAVGSAGSGISFLPNGTSAWSGIGFHTAGSGTLEYCLLDDASSGLTLSSSGTVSVANTTISNGSYGINASDGALELASVTITGNSSYGVYGNSVAPVFLDDNNLFEGNGTGLYVNNVVAPEFSTAATFRNNTTTGLHFNNCESPSLDNLVFENHTGNNGALFFAGCGEFFIGGGTAIGGPGVENSWPLSMDIGSYPHESCMIPTTGNLENNIRVHGGSTDRTIVWPFLAGLDYIVTGTPNIAAGGEFIVLDGMEIHFNNSRGLNIYGTLTALGSSGDGISFLPYGTSNWAGIGFHTAGSGSLDHCLLDQASSGLTLSSSGTVSVANTTISNGSYGINASDGALEMASSTLTGNSSYGVYANTLAPVFMDSNNVFENNGTGLYVNNVDAPVFSTAATFVNNTTTGLYFNDCQSPSLDNLVFENHSGTNGAIFLAGCGEFFIGGGNSIGGTGVENSWPLSMNIDSYPAAGCVIPTSGNTNNNLRVHGGSTSRNIQWPVLSGLDYVVTGTGNISAGDEFVVPDGMEIYFNNSRGFNIYGTLTAEGSAGDGISFLPNGTGNWAGLNFLTAGGGTIEHCLVERASTGISANTSGTVTVVGTTVTNCAYGVNATEGNLSFINCRILDNSSYGIYVIDGILTFGSDLTEWNDIYGNGTGGPGRDYYNGPNDVHAGWVYWGTMHQMEIWHNTYDELDDEDHGYLDFIPHANEAHEYVITAVEDEDEVPGSVLPARTVIHQNHPNPFNPSTLIQFDLHRASEVMIQVYDLSGARIRTLIHEPLTAGRHQVMWKGDDDAGRRVASGTYLYRFEAGQVTETRSMLLIK